MIHYRDMTFCTHYKSCKDGVGCERALTNELMEKADKWWGGKKWEAPICTFVGRPECFKEVDCEE